MKKPTDPRDTLRQLNKAADRQNQQFVASLLVTIAILMKQQGMTEIEISPEALATLQPGETLHPIESVSGGIAFKFFSDAPAPLAKLPSPPVLKAVDTKKGRRK